MAAARDGRFEIRADGSVALGGRGPRPRRGGDPGHAAAGHGRRPRRRAGRGHRHRADRRAAGRGRRPRAAAGDPGPAPGRRPGARRPDRGRRRARPGGRGRHRPAPRGGRGRDAGRGRSPSGPAPADGPQARVELAGGAGDRRDPPASGRPERSAMPPDRDAALPARAGALAPGPPLDRLLRARRGDRRRRPGSPRPGSSRASTLGEPVAVLGDWCGSRTSTTAGALFGLFRDQALLFAVAQHRR